MLEEWRGIKFSYFFGKFPGCEQGQIGWGGQNGRLFTTRKPFFRLGLALVQANDFLNKRNSVWTANGRIFLERATQPLAHVFIGNTQWSSFRVIQSLAHLFVENTKRPNFLCTSFHLLSQNWRERGSAIVHTAERTLLSEHWCADTAERTLLRKHCSAKCARPRVFARFGDFSSSSSEFYRSFAYFGVVKSAYFGTPDDLIFRRFGFTLLQKRWPVFFKV